MRVRCWMALLPAVVMLGCHGYRDSGDNVQSLTPERRATVEDGVRRFAATVAHDVTQEGPIAWRKHFAETPAFFMAVNGKLAFPSGQAAAQAMPEVARTYKHIDLHWGNDLRVDALTPELAVMATSYDEVLDDAQGNRLAASGYFTGVAELRNGQWKFRDAHWSVPVPPAKSP
jgi:hypothetical protein